MEDTQINLMGLNSGQQIFLTQEDQQAHTLGQFQIQSGESFDFKERYDTVVYEVHKQYNLRSRRIDISDDNKQKETKQPTKAKNKNSSTQIPPKKIPNSNSPTIQDIIDGQEQDKQFAASFPPKESVKEPLESDIEVDSIHNNTPDKEKGIENTTEKENLAARNAKVQIEKPFNLEQK